MTTNYPILFSTLTTYSSCPAFHTCIHNNNLSNIFSPQQPLTHLALNFVFVSMTTYLLLFFQRNFLPILPCILCLYPCQQLTQYPLPPPPPSNHLPILPCILCLYPWQLTQSPPQQPLTHLALHFALVSMTTYPISPPATTYPSCPAFCACMHDNNDLPNICLPPQQPLTHLALHFVLVCMTTMTYPIFASPPATTYPSCPAFCACMHDNNDLPNICLPPQQPLTHLALHFVLVCMTTMTYPIFASPHSNHLPILPCILCLYAWQQWRTQYLPPPTATTYPSCPAFCACMHDNNDVPNICLPPQQPLTHLALHFVLVCMTTMTYPIFASPHSNHLPILPCILCLYAWQQWRTQYLPPPTATTYPSCPAFCACMHDNNDVPNICLPPQQPLTHLALHFVLVCMTTMTYPIFASPHSNHLPILPCILCLYAWQQWHTQYLPPPTATTYPSCPAFCACMHDNNDIPNICLPPQQPLTHLALHFVLVCMTTMTYPIFASPHSNHLPILPCILCLYAWQQWHTQYLPPPTATTYPSCPAFCACMHDNNDLPNICLPPQQPLTHLALHFVLVCMTTMTYPIFASPHSNHLPILPCILCLYPVSLSSSSLGRSGCETDMWTRSRLMLEQQK